MRALAAALALTIALFCGSPAGAEQAVGNGNAPVWLAWTPTDTSGAAVPLSVNAGGTRYWQLGTYVAFTLNVTYSVTASGSGAQISIPVTQAGGTQGGAVCTDTDVTTPVSIFITGGNALFLTTASSTQKTNVQLSTHNVVCNGFYEGT